MAETKPPSKKEEEAKKTRTRKPIPLHEVAAESAIITISAPTIGNIKRTLATVAGESNSKPVKDGDTVSAVRLTEGGALQIKVNHNV